MNGVMPSRGEGPAPDGRDQGPPWTRLKPILSTPTPIIFVAAVAVAAVLLWRSGALSGVGSSLRHTDPAVAAAILLAYAFSVSIQCARWHVLTRLAGGTPPWATSGEVFLTSLIVNYAAPIGLAVPTRAALGVRDLGLTPAQSGAVITWEAGLDIAALATISLIWIALSGPTAMPDIAGGDRLVLVAGTGTAALALALLALTRRSRVRVHLEPIFRLLLAAPRRSPRAALLAVGLTAFFWTVQTAVMDGLLRIFGVDATLSLLSGMMGLPVLIGMLSPIPGGAGVREALMVAAAHLQNVPSGPVALAAVAYRLALFVVTPAVWGAIRLARLRRPLR